MRTFLSRLYAAEWDTLLLSKRMVVHAQGCRISCGTVNDTTLVCDRQLCDRQFCAGRRVQVAQGRAVPGLLPDGVSFSVAPTPAAVPS